MKKSYKILYVCIFLVLFPLSFLSSYGFHKITQQKQIKEGKISF